jgi:mannitol/fructose-specific phosphotransferase system IIA component (Ntr-type)
MGTAVEEGIAFPHARLKGLASPLVVFARSVQGIDWDSPDGKATGLIFLILTPLEDDEAQVQILGNIARTMFDKSNRNALIQGGDTGEIWTALHTVLTPLHLIRK